MLDDDFLKLIEDIKPRDTEKKLSTQSQVGRALLGLGALVAGGKYSGAKGIESMGNLVKKVQDVPKERELERIRKAKETLSAELLRKKMEEEEERKKVDKAKNWLTLNKGKTDLNFLMNKLADYEKMRDLEVEGKRANIDQTNERTLGMKLNRMGLIPPGGSRSTAAGAGKFDIPPSVKSDIDDEGLLEYNEGDVAGLRSWAQKKAHELLAIDQNLTAMDFLQNVWPRLQKEAITVRDPKVLDIIRREMVSVIDPEASEKIKRTKAMGGLEPGDPGFTGEEAIANALSKIVNPAWMGLIGLGAGGAASALTGTLPFALPAMMGIGGATIGAHMPEDSFVYKAVDKIVDKVSEAPYEIPMPDDAARDYLLPDMIRDSAKHLGSALKTKLGSLSNAIGDVRNAIGQNGRKKQSSSDFDGITQSLPSQKPSPTAIDSLSNAISDVRSAIGKKLERKRPYVTSSMDDYPPYMPYSYLKQRR